MKIPKSYDKIRNELIGVNSRRKKAGLGTLSAFEFVKEKNYLPIHEKQKESSRVSQAAILLSARIGREVTFSEYCKVMNIDFPMFDMTSGYRDFEKELNFLHRKYFNEVIT